MTVPVCHSTPNPEALVEIIEERFPVGRVRNVQLYRAYVNDVYRLTGDDGTGYVLNIFRREWHDLESIEWEAALQRHLFDSGIGVSAPIPQGNGEATVALATPEGTGYAVLYPEAPGEKPGPPHDTSLYEHVGLATARMHNAMDGFAVPCPRPGRDVDGLVHRSSALIQASLPDAPHARAQLRDIGRWLQSTLGTRSVDLSFGVCHGDLTLDNLTVDDDNRITFFDFDLAHRGFRAAEVAGLFGWAQETEIAESYWQAFLSGYRLARPFGDLEESLMPEHVVAYQRWELAHEIEYWRAWSGYGRITDNMVADRLQRLHEQVALP